MHDRPFPFRCGVGCVCAALLLALVWGCSDSTEPGGGGTPPADVPDIPEPARAGAETPAASDTVTVIFPLRTHFRPLVKSALANWGIQTRCCQRVMFGGDWQCEPWATLVGMQPTWSDSLPLMSIDRCGDPVDQTGTVAMARPDPWCRILVFQDGAIIDPPAGDSGVETMWEFSIGNLVGASAQCQFHWQTRPIAETPYLRRDRTWVRQEITGVGNFLILIGDVQGTISTSRTSGSSVTETEEFGRSVTVSAGLELGALSAGVEVTLSQTFSTAVTVSEEVTDTFSQAVQGEDGKVVHYQVWQMVERYAITDAAGELYTDPNYKLEPSRFTIRNGALALVATKFDAP